MKKILVLLSFLVVGLYGIVDVRAAGFIGETPVAGTDYYLYNVYQAKFMTRGNGWGTQASLIPFGDAGILKVTLESAGGNKYKLNTHIVYNTKAWNAAVDNYLANVEGVPYVDAYYNSQTTSDHVTGNHINFTLTEADEGWYITSQGGGDLMFDSGTACMLTDKGDNTVLKEKALWRFIPVSEYEAMGAKSRFTVAAMNVDGMPKSVKILGVYTLNLNSDAKEADGATAIGQKLVGMGYDYIGVSEDFNYNSEIMAQIGGSYNQMTHRGGITISASTYTRYLAGNPLFDTDGLNLFYKNSLGVTGEYWTAWNEHYGYTDHEADGLIKKGYRYYLLTLPDGSTQVDLYIFHMEAGSDEGDIGARSTQLTQFANAILATDNRRPIIVMGDTNCRYTRDQLKSLFVDVVSADPRFTVKDAWVEYGRSGAYPSYGAYDITAGNYGYRRGEVVDKVLFINNTDSNIRLVCEAYRQDLSFINDAGEPLADHWPCVVDFSYHTYDPAIDDVVEDDLSQEGAYLCNVETGDFLKCAGWWGTHAALGKYGYPVNIAHLGNGKYTLATGRGDGYVGGDDPFFDAAEARWTISQVGDYYMLVNANNHALCKGDANNYAQGGIGPNTYYVQTATPNVADRGQLWEILSLDELKARMALASESSPVNCSYLIGSANFDRNDRNIYTNWTWQQGDDFSKHGSRSTGGWDTDHLANQVHQVFIGSGVFGEGSNNYFKLYQELRGLPAGKYKVTCQGFYRDGGAGTGSETKQAFLFANGHENVTAKLPNIQDARYVQGSSQGVGEETNAYGGYVPNDMESAACYFSKGLYPVEVIVNVGSEGTLSIGIQKDDRDKGTEQWTCWDNFQLFYYGFTPSSGDAGYFYNVDGGAFLSTNGSTDAVVTGWGTRVVLDPNAGIEWTKVASDTHYKLRSSSNYLGLVADGETDPNGYFTAWSDRTDNGETQFDIIPDGDYYTLKHVATANTQVGWSGDMSTKVPFFKLSVNDKELRGTRWAVLTSEQYDILRPNVSATYDTRRTHWPVVRAARNTSVVETSDEMAVWESPASTTAQLNTMANLLREKLTTQLDDATKTTPIDLSYLIVNADFSGAITTGWTNDGFGVHEDYYKATSANGPALGNRFGERWVTWLSALPNSDLYQTIAAADLPAGSYRLTVDVRLDRWDGSTPTGISLYAKPGSRDEVATVCDIAGGVNSVLEIASFQVEEGEALKVGIRIKDTESVNWMAFDNFHLYYIGPNHSTVQEDSNGDAVNETLSLYGTWRTSEQDELTALVNSNVKAVMLNTATVKGPLTIPTASQPNMVIYATKASDVTNTQNVVVNSRCTSFVLTDKRDFCVPVDFTASRITYNRENTGGYNTVCLPFGFTYSQIATLFGAGSEVYMYRRKGVTSGGEDYLSFERVESGDEVEPGRPCLIYSEATTWTNYNRYGSFPVVGSPVVGDAIDFTDDEGNDIHIDAEPVRGVFQNGNLGVGYYKLNSAGTAFVRSTAASTIKPFRFFVDPATFPAEVKQLRFFIEEPDGIREVTEDVKCQVSDVIYDLQGRKLSKSQIKKGIYIQNGRKTVIR